MKINYVCGCKKVINEEGETIFCCDEHRIIDNQEELLNTLYGCLLKN